MACPCSSRSNWSPVSHDFSDHRNPLLEVAVSCSINGLVLSGTGVIDVP